jgi:hypothetical protein
LQRQAIFYIIALVDKNPGARSRAYFCIPCEPPSGFLDNRENTGNFDHFGYFERRKAKEYEAITVTYERIPYRGEQGI